MPHSISAVKQTNNGLEIEWNGSKITLDSLDLREEYPKPKPVEKTVEVKIDKEGRVTKIGSLLDHSQKGKWNNS